MFLCFSLQAAWRESILHQHRQHARDQTEAEVHPPRQRPGQYWNPHQHPSIVLLFNPVLTVRVLFMYKIIAYWDIHHHLWLWEYSLFQQCSHCSPLPYSIHVSSWWRGFLSNSASCFLSKQFCVKRFWAFRSLDCSFFQIKSEESCDKYGGVFSWNF